MVKKCEVIFYNKHLNIVVFEYDGKKVQTTFSLDDGCKSIYVEFKSNKYEIVTKEEYEKNKRIIKKKDIHQKEMSNEVNSEL